MAVDWVRPEISFLLPIYTLIRDVIGGEVVVKGKGTTYLPMPNSADTSTANIARYGEYRSRAVFYGVTKRTLAGLVGQVFVEPPVIEVPPLLDAVVKDANGSGLSLEQLADKTLQGVLSYGRYGIFTDFPTTVGQAVTREQQLSGNIRPTINVYQPWQIINWRTITRGGRIILSLVVLEEAKETEKDDFEIEIDRQWRVLKLNPEGLYEVDIYVETTANRAVERKETFIPLDYRGQRLDEIPFTFVGAQNNDTYPDEPPLYDMASLNIAHYRNSADYEEAAFMLGQPTPVFTGLTQDWADKYINNGAYLGSRNTIPLPVGADAKLLTVSANTMIFEAMQMKERQMVALGAKLVEQTNVQRTATEANIEEAAESSVLTRSTKNVSAAFKWSLEWAGIFSGAVTVRGDATNETIKFELNTDFTLASASPDEIRAIVENWQKGAITFSEMRAQLRQAGQATLDDDQARTEIEGDDMRTLSLTDVNAQNDNEDEDKEKDEDEDEEDKLPAE